MRKHRASGTVPAERTGKVWLQRFAGIALGGLAGTAAAYSVDLVAALGNAEADTANAGETQRDATLPPPTANETGLQIAHTLMSRARDLIARGEIKEAERFLAAAETLAPGHPALVETWKLLDLAKAKIELAKQAPATGQAERPASADPKKKPPGDQARAADPKPDSPDAAVDFAEGVKEFKAKNYNVALAALGRAAATGYPPAQNYLGYMYRHGHGVPQDLGRALSWYQKAAAQNHAGAMNNIGFLYRQGLGVAQDNAEARSWFRKSADRGDSVGQYNLAQMLAEGAGADHREAAKWYRAAAEQGHPRAAMGLAHLYSQGLGIAPDPVEAYFWYGIAARSGVEGAQRFRTVLGAQISAAQRQTADARVAGWKLQNAEGEGQ